MFQALFPPLRCFAAVFVVVFAASLGLALHPREQDSPQVARKPDRIAKRHEEPLPANAVVLLGTTRLRHAARVETVRFSPDGKTLASVSMDRTTILWDANTGKSIWRHGTAFGNAYGAFGGDQIAFAPDGKSLVCGVTSSGIPSRSRSRGKRVYSVNIADGKEGMSLCPGDSSIISLAISPDGKTLAASDETGAIFIWDLVKRVERLQLEMPKGRRYLTYFTRDSKGVLIAEKDGAYVRQDVVKGTISRIYPTGEIELLDLASGKKKTLFTVEKGGISAMDLAPDGDLLAVLEGYRVHLWRLSTQKLVRTLKERDTRAVAFSPDKKTMAVVYGNPSWDICLLDVETGKEQLRLPDYAYSLAFSPDGLRLATAGHDSAIRVWDVKTGQPALDVGGPTDSVGCLAFSKDGKTLCCGENGGNARIWDVSSGEQTHVRQVRNKFGDWDGFGAIRLVGDRVLVTPNFTPYRFFEMAKKEPIVWDARTGGALLQIDPLIPGKDSMYVFPVELSPDGKTAVIGGMREIALLEVATGRETLRLKPQGDKGVYEARFSADGRRLITSSTAADHSYLFQVWDVISGKEVSSFKERWSGTIALSPDGKVVAEGKSECIVFRDADTGKELRRTKKGGEKALAFSADGDTLAAATWYGEVYLWDVRTAGELVTLAGHSGGVRSLAFDGSQRLATAGFDTTVLVWDLARAAGGSKVEATIPKQMETAWADLAKGDLRAAYWASLVFRRDPDKTITFLTEVFHPITNVSAKRLRQLIADLDDDAFLVREKATKELTVLANSAEVEVRAALKETTSVELQLRARKILASLAFTPEERERRAVTAIRLLEDFGTSKARKLLEAHSRGLATAAQTKAAKAALHHLEASEQRGKSPSGR